MHCKIYNALMFTDVDYYSLYRWLFACAIAQKLVPVNEFLVSKSTSGAEVDMHTDQHSNR